MVQGFQRPSEAELDSGRLNVRTRLSYDARKVHLIEFKNSTPSCGSAAFTFVSYNDSKQALNIINVFLRMSFTNQCVLPSRATDS